ncbi:enoyl-CoA hydratase/isomerase family protein [Pseudaquabacterium rugosum]|uniref:Enoyl-CoA hydratase-related protein n=1 Tax=Pseudaquabacterium rugosum TaxID=2984194 RepID=A0ABU9B7P0_9BURK
MPPDTDSPLLLRRDGALARIVFNRPRQLNAIDVATAEAFEQACATLATDPGLRVVVVQGEGRGFGAGGDLRAFGDDAPATALALIEPMHRGLLHLSRLDAPVIASLQGSVSGGSLSLALGCDLAIAADDLRLNLAYAQVAASCDVGGSWHLPRLVGLRRAMEIALLGPSLDAATALSWGLVNQVVPAAELAQATTALAQRLAQGPTAAYGRLKRLLRAAHDHDLPTQLDLERDGFHQSTRTADFREALQAFRERRAPRFQGR